MARITLSQRRLTVQRASVSVSTSGANTLVAAPGAGLRIVLLRSTLVAAGSVSVTFKSNTTALSGAMPLPANGNGLSDCDPIIGLFECAENEPLVLTLSAAVAVTGYLSYALEPV